MSLERFTEAQERVWPAPLEEIRRGRKDSHWMWFVFPQLKGLGRSATALRYGIADRAEAEAYLAHPVLGPRLVEISRAMLTHDDIAAETILGPVDALKLRSCATLFEAAGGGAVFARILDSFYDGKRCHSTLDLLD
ncbi:DUF1810 domain-containing protein [Roseovarius sp.]|uniref:DUF1810 domain-containing protein n=1 Tax=Roseovarius sp. TaxID=1486281 RepID=UPI00261B3DD6|nr:DUF1810 domain-containing protein [Roseovarius sp.]MDM8164758.1 DUF1810 domain-containing protein [Roseovarius sp.]